MILYVLCDFYIQIVCDTAYDSIKHAYEIKRKNIIFSIGNRLNLQCKLDWKVNVYIPELIFTANEYSSHNTIFFAIGFTLFNWFVMSFYIYRTVCNRVYRLPLLTNELNVGNVVVQPVCWEISRVLNCKMTVYNCSSIQLARLQPIK